MIQACIGLLVIDAALFGFLSSEHEHIQTKPAHYRVMDVRLGEDQTSTRAGYAAENPLKRDRLAPLSRESAEFRLERLSHTTSRPSTKLFSPKSRRQAGKSRQ
jgi:hypothetical protein